jgi:hypothetical protein
LKGVFYRVLRFPSGTPPLIHFLFLFYLGNRHSKKTLLLISAEGKKWSLHYLQQQIGGKKWESVVGESGGKCGEGIIPHA